MNSTFVKGVFLSRVNSEFGQLDDQIRHYLRVSVSATVEDQTGFATQQAGHGTLRKLLDKLRRTDAAIHYLSAGLGSRVGSDGRGTELIAKFLRFEPEVEAWLGRRRLREAAESWTYTQWEAYLALFLQETQARTSGAIALICYHIIWPAQQPCAEVEAHWQGLKALGAHVTRVDLSEHHRTDTGDAARKLAFCFLDSTLAFAPRQDETALERGKQLLGDTLYRLVEEGAVSCTELATLAFPLCKQVLTLHASSTQTMHFISNLLELLSSASAKQNLLLALVHLHAVQQLVAARTAPAATQIAALADRLARDLDCDPAIVINHYRTTFPDCFPRYPLALCVEIFVEKIAANSHSVKVSLRVGHHRQFIDGEPCAGTEPDNIDSPQDAIRVALERTSFATDRLGGVERYELMIDDKALQTDADYRQLLSTPWNDFAHRHDGEEVEPVVLRWPHTERSARLIDRLAPDAYLALGTEQACAGISLLRGNLDDLSIDRWKLALKRSTLTLWERDPRPMAAVHENMHWRTVPAQLKCAELAHLGVAMNPPEAPVYQRRGQGAAERNLKTALMLGL
jgi:hypothetical protein